MRLEDLRAADLPVTAGRFTVTDVLGEGGMARVYRARMAGGMGFERPVALKVVLPSAVNSARQTEQLVQEARLGGLLNHPNVAQVFDCGLLGTRPYIAMELIEGVGLDELMDELGPLPWEAACAVAVQVARGLQHAHEARHQGLALGLVHRDIKPSNVMVRGDGVVKVVDFGIAKADISNSVSTATGVTKGTPVYMAPEQLEALQLDARTDLFALGVVMHQMLTGSMLFQGPSLPAVVLRVMRVDEIVKTHKVRGDLDALAPGLGEIVCRLLARDPAQRYPSAGDFLLDMEQLLPVSPEPILGRLVRKHFPARFERRGDEDLPASTGKVSPVAVPAVSSAPVVHLIRAVVVDDEPLGRKRIMRLLGDHPDVEVVGEAGDGGAARAAVLRLRPDLLLLDVNMPGEDGVSALRSLRELLPEDQLPLAVFTTAHEEHALAAHELEGTDFLVKPVDRIKLARALKRVRKTLARRPQASAPALPQRHQRVPTLVDSGPLELEETLVPDALPEPSPIPGFNRAGSITPLRLADIAVVCVEDTITWAITPNGRYRLKPTLMEMEEQLPAPPFFRVGRAALLNLEWLATLEPVEGKRWVAHLKDPLASEAVDVSRRRGQDLKKQLGL